MNIVTIVGARPQLIKAAPVSRAIQKHNRKGSDTQIKEVIVYREHHSTSTNMKDVSSCGQTIDWARNNLKTAVRLFIEEAEKMGTLDDILRESGYEKGAN